MQILRQMKKFKMLPRAQCNQRFDENINRSNEILIDVCAEEYKGSSYGYPYFQTGFIRQNCSNSRSLHSIVSFAIYFKNDRQGATDQCTCKDVMKNVLDGISRHYPKVPIHVTTESDDCRTTLQKYKNVISVESVSGSSAGQVWSELISRVKTKYVVIARDLQHFWNFSSIERQIDMITNIPSVKVVGGAYRNATRHWHVGCLQSEMKNYVLKYNSGYQISRNECMFCDHLEGPFVALTEVFDSVPLDSKLPESVVFTDFFLSLKDKQAYTMNCPDVMYYSSPPAHDRTSWLKIASKWSLNYVLFPDGNNFKYSCQDIEMSCNNLKMMTRFYLMPPCCVEEMALAVKFFKDFCTNRSIYYEFLAGSVLGAVKMADVIPWDLDGDAEYYSSNHTVIKDAQAFFKQNGLSLSDIEDPVCCNENGEYKSSGYIQLNTPQMYIELFGTSDVADEVLPPNNLRKSHTLIKIHDVWVNGPPNPGLYARNRYGREILKHAQSWIHVGKASSWDEYEAGHFKPCPKHNFHSCLDRFPTDGNLAFKLPT